MPILEGIMSKKWGKEDELKLLKSGLAALERLIAQALSIIVHHNQWHDHSAPSVHNLIIIGPSL